MLPGKQRIITTCAAPVRHHAQSNPFAGHEIGSARARTAADGWVFPGSPGHYDRPSRAFETRLTRRPVTRLLHARAGPGSSVRVGRSARQARPPPHARYGCQRRPQRVRPLARLWRRRPDGRAHCRPRPGTRSAHQRGLASRAPPSEGHEHDLVTAVRHAIPRAVLTNKSTAREALRKIAAPREC